MQAEKHSARWLALARKHGASVLVYKLDRWMRTQFDHHTTRADLFPHGALILSATEPIIDDPVGQFLGGTLAGVAELDNAIRAERCKNGMTARARAGWWVWKAPIGY